MPWTDSSPTSRIFTQALLNPILRAVNAATAPTTYASLTGDALVKAALFNNSVSPDASAAVGSTGFNTGTWVTANEVTDATNWVSGGRALASKTFSALTAGSQTTASSIAFDAADTAGGGNVTIANAYGALVHDGTITGGSTVADQGMCFNYFGGAQGVTAGTFTIVWDATGIFKVTN
jgi:hypothetical protein